MKRNSFLLRRHKGGGRSTTQSKSRSAPGSIYYIYVCMYVCIYIYIYILYIYYLSTRERAEEVRAR
jgi:hypothetical protein